MQHKNKDEEVASTKTETSLLTETARCISNFPPLEISQTYDVSTWVGIGAGDRSNIDDMAFPALNHSGQDSLGRVKQALAIDVHHGFPVLNDAILDGQGPKGETGIVHQNIDVAELAWQASDGLEHSRLVRNINGQSLRGLYVLIRLKVLAQVLQKVLPAARDDQADGLLGRCSFCVYLRDGLAFVTARKGWSECEGGTARQGKARQSMAALQQSCNALQ